MKEAGDAYQDLFQSDIFKFPESQSEYNRVEAIEDQDEEGHGRLEELRDAAPSGQTVTDNAPSTLPQILHLSYKNRAEYELDLLRVLAKEGGLQGSETRQDDGDSLNLARHRCRKALADFAEALDKDENDSDLWRRASRISQTLGSRRVFRFCLEAALGGEEADTDDILGLRNVEARFDQDRLKELQKCIQDDVSLIQGPLSASEAKGLPSVLNERLAPYPFLAKVQQLHRPQGNPEGRKTVVLEIPESSLDAIGLALLQRATEERNGLASAETGSLVRLRMPPPDAKLGGVLEPPIMAAERLSNRLGVSSGQENPLTSSISPVLDKSMQDNSRRERQDSVKSIKDSAVVDLPTRKRSSEVADFPETTEGERARSKRIRNRQSNVFERDAVEPSVADKLSGQDQRIKACIHADRWIFDHTRSLAKRIGASVLSSSDDIRSLVMPETSSKRISDGNHIPLRQAIQDFYAAMLSWTSQKGQAFLRKDSAEDSVADTSNAGLSAFLDNANAGGRVNYASPIKDGAHSFADYVASQGVTTEMAAILWIRCLLTQSCLRDESQDVEDDIRSSSYLSHLWSDVLKTSLVQMVIAVDENLFEYVIHLSSNRQSTETCVKSVRKAPYAVILAQALFELHLDIYTRITNPASEVDQNTRVQQKARLSKWCNLARDLLASLTEDEIGNESLFQGLVSRHSWASVFHLQSIGEISREHLIVCVEDLKCRLESMGSPLLKLPNNAAMPEISVEAAGKEISKLETMDFFLSIFHKDDQHSVDLIERLEPVLMSTVAGHADVTSRAQKSDATSKRVDSRRETDNNQIPEFDFAGVRTSSQEVLSKFVSKSNASLRLSLWYRLRDAYRAVGINAKVLLINVHIFELIISELQSHQYLHADSGGREGMLLKWLHEFDNLLSATYEIVMSHPDALECLEDSAIRSFLSVLSNVWTLLHAVALYDDYSQISQKVPPLTNPFRAYPSESFHSASIKLHEMQLRSVILMYLVLVDGMKRHPEKYPEALKHRHEYLSYIHYALGMRRICKASDNLFLKFMGSELRELAAQGRPISEELAQILYDLYDLHLFSTPTERQDHGCEADYLDRPTALELIDLVLEKARNVNMKDMHKIELGKTVEKLQGALGSVKATNNTSRNRKIYNSFIKSPLDPTDMFQCLRGVGSLSTVPIDPEEVPVASKGWYQLIPQITLAKYRRMEGQLMPGVAEELETAVGFLVHDLEYDMERWETWQCLANAYDFLTDEAVLRSAEKINTGRHELVQTQRASIHAYSMAVAAGIRTAPPGEETSNKFAELYSDFGVRMYSSSRPPFSMQVFEVDHVQDKHYCGPAVSGGIYMRKGPRGLQLDQALRVACVLFRKAIRLKPKNWV